MMRQRKPRAAVSRPKKKFKTGARRTVLTDRVVSVPPSVRDLQYFDYNNTATTAATMQYQELFTPVQGNASNSRFGDKIVMHSIQWRFRVNSSATLPIRVILLYDAQPNGALPTSPQPLTALRVEAMKDPDTRHRFTIIRDWYLTNKVGVYVSANDEKHDGVQTGLTKFSEESYFTGNAGTIADIRTGSYILCYYDGAADNQAITYEFRFLFTS